MAGTSTAIFPQVLANAGLTLTNSSGTTITSLYVAGAQSGNANGSRINNIIVTSTDTGSRTIALYATISGTNYLIGSAIVGAQGGFVGSLPPIELLKAINYLAQNEQPATYVFATDAYGNPFLDIANGTTIKVAVTVAIDSGKQIQLFMTGGDF